jgi:DNA-binding GntR family transcriptional regulator
MFCHGFVGTGCAVTINTSLIDLDPNMPVAQGLPDRIYSAPKTPHPHLLPSAGPAFAGERPVARTRRSCTPLREALNRLALENLVFLTPYRGYAVTPVHLHDIRHLSGLRLIVESEASALAAERGTPEEVEQLATLAPLDYPPGDRATYVKYLRANSAFHQALVRRTHNERLVSVAATVLDQIQRTLYRGLDAGLQSDVATAQHLELVAAIRARNPAQARQLAAEQIRRAESRIVAVVSAADLNSV